MVEASGRREFPGRADQVALARRFAVDALGPRSQLRDEVSLLVSEAVTNALLHSSSGTDLLEAPEDVKRYRHAYIGQIRAQLTTRP